MTLNCYKFEFFGEFRRISQIREATTVKRMKIDWDPYCQRQCCNQHKAYVPSDIIFLALICLRFLSSLGAFIHALLSCLLSIS